MLLIYTGNGKGKSCASVGQCVRALGQGFSVVFGQFMKREDQAGEQNMLEKLLGESFFAGGEGFFRKAEDYDAHRAAAQNVLLWARKRIDSVPAPKMLVLDEALYALGSKLLLKEELLEFIQKCRQDNIHLVLSGRGLPDWLEKEADLITSMELVKHPHNSGVKAQKGIEF